MKRKKMATQELQEFRKIDDVTCVIITVQMAVNLKDVSEATEQLLEAGQSYGCAEIIERFAVANTLDECSKILRKKAVKE
jgi:hypothetical protein